MLHSLPSVGPVLHSQGEGSAAVHLLAKETIEVTSFSVAICMKQTKILCGQLNCSAKFADVSTRCSSHPQGKRILIRLFQGNY